MNAFSYIPCCAEDTQLYLLPNFGSFYCTEGKWLTFSKATNSATPKNRSQWFFFVRVIHFLQEVAIPL